MRHIVNRGLDRLASSAVTSLALVALAACSGAPLDSDTASSTVRLSFAGAKTSAGMDVCAETDSAAITVAPDGETTRGQGRSLGSGECGAEFGVTVPRGLVRFTGALLGARRTLFRGAASHQAEEDGFVVIIDLDEIEALAVKTRTIGLGGPAAYEFSVDDGPRIPIGADDEVMVGALAAGGRVVALFPDPCVVVGEDAPRVSIPVDESQLGEHEFEVDCNQGGTITILIETTGGGGPSGFTIGIGDTMVPVSRSDSVDVSGILPGPIEVVPDVGGCAATVTPAQPFLPTAGAITILVSVDCSQAGGAPAPLPPPPPPAPSVQISAIRLVTTAPRTPAPGEITTFDYRITDARGATAAGSIGVNDSVTVQPLDALENPHEVELIQTGSCIVTSMNPQIVTLTAGSTLRVEFSVGC